MGVPSIEPSEDSAHTPTVGGSTLHHAMMHASNSCKLQEAHPQRLSGADSLLSKLAFPAVTGVR